MGAELLSFQASEVSCIYIRWIPWILLLLVILVTLLSLVSQKLLQITRYCQLHDPLHMSGAPPFI